MNAISSEDSIRAFPLFQNFIVYSPSPRISASEAIVGERRVASKVHPYLARTAVPT